MLLVTEAEGQRSRGAEGAGEEKTIARRPIAYCPFSTSYLFPFLQMQTNSISPIQLQSLLGITSVDGYF
jgi:hypothetical protein